MIRANQARRALVDLGPRAKSLAEQTVAEHWSHLEGEIDLAVRSAIQANADVVKFWNIDLVKLHSAFYARVNAECPGLHPDETDKSLASALVDRLTSELAEAGYDGIDVSPDIETIPERPHSPRLPKMSISFRF